MAIDNLYVSHANYDWYSNKSPGTFLDQKNIKNIVDDVRLYDCYTSLEDITVENLSLLFSSKHIHLVDIDETVLNDSSFLYFSFLQKLSRREEFEKLTWINKLKNNLQSTQQTRNTDDRVLWAAGCSVTYGEGVDKTERFSAILAKQLKIQELSLAKSGSSLSWSADQLLRSDIRKDDIVIWGLTTFSRIDVSNNFNLESCPAVHYDSLEKKYQYWNLDYFDSNTLITTCLRQILQVKNFCAKIGAKLYIINLIDVHAPVLLYGDNQFYDLSPELDYADKRWKYLDFGSDDLHPGPKQHQLYADTIYKLIVP